MGAGGLAGVIPGSILSAGSQDAPRSRDSRGGRNPRHVDGHNDRKWHRTRSTGHQMTSVACETSRTCLPRSRRNGVNAKEAGTKDGPGTNDFACLARSLRAEEASSFAFESRFRLTYANPAPSRTVETTIHPTPTRIATPRTVIPRKMGERA